MDSTILAFFVILFSGLGLYFAHVCKIGRQQVIEARKNRAAKYAEYQQLIEIEQAKTAKLQFTKTKEYDTDKASPFEGRSVTYSRLLTHYIKKSSYYSIEWLEPTLSRLRSQNEVIDFTFQDIKHLIDLLEQKGLADIAAQCKLHVQSVLNEYSKNRDQSVLLFQKIRESTDQKIIQKQKRILDCLTNDNDELIKGLEFSASTLRKVLAPIYEDEHPDYITDFTGLHSLLEIMTMMDRVVAETTAQKEAEKAQKAKSKVPTIEMPPRNKRTVDYFPNMWISEDEQLINNSHDDSPSTTSKSISG